MSLISCLKSVADIVNEFQSANVAIPEIQRDVVWDAEQIKSLIDSVSQGYPCGALIYWDQVTGGHNNRRVRGVHTA